MPKIISGWVNRVYKLLMTQQISDSDLRRDRLVTAKNSAEFSARGEKWHRKNPRQMDDKDGRRGREQS